MVAQEEKLLEKNRKRRSTMRMMDRIDREEQLKRRFEMFQGDDSDDVVFLQKEAQDRKDAAKRKGGKKKADQPK